MRPTAPFAVRAAFQPVDRLLETWHSELFGYYVVWIVVELAAIAGCVAFLSMA